MTVGHARAILSYVWVVFAIPLLGIVFIQTIRQRYEWETGFGWLIPLLFPILAFMIATWTASQTRKEQVVLKNKFVFVSCILFSLAYLLALYAILWQMPREIGDLDQYVDRVMRASSWYLGAF